MAPKSRQIKDSFNFSKKLKSDFNLASSDIKKTINILITRSRENSLGLENQLKQLGFCCFFEPLFSVKKIHIAKQDFSEFSAAIITSANAINGLIETNLPKNIKIFCVGKVTAQKLTTLGFSNIITPEKQNAQSLLQLIKSEKDDGKIVYFHGSVITLDFAKELPNITKIQTYETNEHNFFSDEFLQFIEQNSCEDILVFSSNSAEIFLRNALKYNLLAYFKSSNLLCLSEKICLKAKEICDKSSQVHFAKISTFADHPILREIYDYIH